MKALQECKLLLPWQDFKCYKAIKKKENVLIEQREAAPQVKVKKRAQGTGAWPMCAEHMQFVCWMWLDTTNGFHEEDWEFLRLGRTITASLLIKHRGLKCGIGIRFGLLACYYFSKLFQSKGEIVIAAISTNKLPYPMLNSHTESRG